MFDIQMGATARALVARGKGILAADESTGTIEKRFNSVGAACTEENWRVYRELLFTTPGLGEFISGVILFDETIRQKAADASPLVDVLQRQGIIPGIKVDKGAKALAGFAGERITEGLDGLRERLAEYRELGARFTKWRAVIAIESNFPTDTCLRANAQALARFAALSQEAGLVPIVEPEVLMDGDHDIGRHAEVTQRMLRIVFDALAEHRVRLEAMLLKPNMVLSGKECPQQASVSEAAEATLSCMRRTVPAAVPGLVFLSGGQSDVRATEHLNAMNQASAAPWELSFSFGRALQAPALKAWAGVPANVPAAQQKLLHRARCNSAARFGNYTARMESLQS
jgi:fructose-bisphosphate aldolase class I